MTMRWNAGLTGLLVGMGLGVFSASANLEISGGVQIHAVADFYAPLTTYGSWVEVGSYGRCWHPAHVAVEWRPYCYGQWVWTDCGWYWQSDEPWGWACYHYGRWIFDPAYGWVWVPEVEWAPAWVYWRVAPDYIGWVPCPPSGAVVAPSLFVFVGVSHLRDPVRPSTVIVNNTTIINRSTQITEFKRETRNLGGVQQRVVVNQGPGVDPIQRATGKSVTPLPIREAVSRTAAPSTLKSTAPASPSAPSRTGKETPRVFEGQPAQPRQQPARPEEPRPRSDQQAAKRYERPTAPPQRPAQPQQQPAPVPPQPRQVPPQQYERPAVPPQTPPGEKVAPPTGKEKERVYPQRPAPAAPPARPVEPPNEKEKEREKDAGRP